MKIFLTSVMTAVLAGVAFAQTDSTHLAGRENKTPGPPGYAQVGDNDRAIQTAVRNARHSLGFFIAVMKAKKPDDSGFEVKKGFVDGDHVEHLWIGDLFFDGQKFHGRINNRPIEVHNVKLGQKVTVAPREVSDWMFVKKGKLMGGYTTRVLYARLSAKDRAEFDKKADFKIE
jgi:uncharacterized protein YegJ (DUF2314 family)